MPRALRLAAALMSVPVLTSSALAGYPMRVRDARGREVLIAARPERIVSLAPSNTEILFALGLADRVVGVTRYCDYPGPAAKKPKVGDMTASAERIVALKPDLVLAHANLNSSAIPRLEKLGVTVFALNPKTIAQVVRDIRTVGRITARPRSAETIAKQMESRIASVKRSAPKTKCRVLVVIQSNPLWAAGPKTFVDEMIRLVNAANVAHDARPGFITFSRELAVARNPDVIVVGIESDAQYFRRSPEWKGTTAVKRNKICLIKSDLLVRPGPRLALGLEELAKAIGS